MEIRGQTRALCPSQVGSKHAQRAAAALECVGVACASNAAKTNGTGKVCAGFGTARCSSCVAHMAGLVCLPQKDAEDSGHTQVQNVVCVREKFVGRLEAHASHISCLQVPVRQVGAW